MSKLIHLKHYDDERGSLISIEGNKSIPFDIKRVYYIYGNKGDFARGFHAHKKLKQFMVCLAGSCRVLLDDGKTKEYYTLDSPEKGIYIWPCIWHIMDQFSTDCVLCVFADAEYNENDYIRNYEEFSNYIDSNKGKDGSFFIHSLSDVQSRCIGGGTKIWQYVVVLPHARIGDDCNICANVFIENNVVIGNRVTVKCGVQLWDGIELEDDVFIGPNVTFTNDQYPKSRQVPNVFPKTIIRKGASIGANATILPGITIGEDALVAAGSVVTRDVPSGVLVQGIPARIIRNL